MSHLPRTEPHSSKSRKRPKTATDSRLAKLVSRIRAKVKALTSAIKKTKRVGFPTGKKGRFVPAQSRQPHPAVKRTRRGTSTGSWAIMNRPTKRAPIEPKDITRPIRIPKVEEKTVFKRRVSRSAANLGDSNTTNTAPIPPVVMPKPNHNARNHETQRNPTTNKSSRTSTGRNQSGSYNSRDPSSNNRTNRNITPSTSSAGAGSSAPSARTVPSVPTGSKRITSSPAVNSSKSRKGTATHNASASSPSATNTIPSLGVRTVLPRITKTSIVPTSTGPLASTKKTSDSMRHTHDHVKSLTSTSSTAKLCGKAKQKNAANVPPSSATRVVSTASNNNSAQQRRPDNRACVPASPVIAIKGEYRQKNATVLPSSSNSRCIRSYSYVKNSGAKLPDVPTPSPHYAYGNGIGNGKQNQANDAFRSANVNVEKGDQSPLNLTSSSVVNAINAMRNRLPDTTSSSTAYGQISFKSPPAPIRDNFQWSTNDIQLPQAPPRFPLWRTLEPPPPMPLAFSIPPPVTVSTCLPTPTIPLVFAGLATSPPSNDSGPPSPDMARTPSILVKREAPRAPIVLPAAALDKPESDVSQNRNDESASAPVIPLKPVSILVKREVSQNQQPILSSVPPLVAERSSASAPIERPSIAPKSEVVAPSTTAVAVSARGVTQKKAITESVRADIEKTSQVGGKSIQIKKEVVGKEVDPASATVPAATTTFANTVSRIAESPLEETDATTPAPPIQLPVEVPLNRAELRSCLDDLLAVVESKMVSDSEARVKREPQLATDSSLRAAVPIDCNRRTTSPGHLLSTLDNNKTQNSAVLSAARLEAFQTSSTASSSQMAPEKSLSAGLVDASQRTYQDLECIVISDDEQCLNEMDSRTCQDDSGISSPSPPVADYPVRVKAEKIPTGPQPKLVPSRNTVVPQSSTTVTSVNRDPPSSESYSPSSSSSSSSPSDSSTSSSESSSQELAHPTPVSIDSPVPPPLSAVHIQAQSLVPPQPPASVVTKRRFGEMKGADDLTHPLETDHDQVGSIPVRAPDASVPPIVTSVNTLPNLVASPDSASPPASTGTASATVDPPPSKRPKTTHPSTAAPHPQDVTCPDKKPCIRPEPEVIVLSDDDDIQEIKKEPPSQPVPSAAASHRSLDVPSPTAPAEVEGSASSVTVSKSVSPSSQPAAVVRVEPGPSSVSNGIPATSSSVSVTSSLPSPAKTLPDTRPGIVKPSVEERESDQWTTSEAAMRADALLPCFYKLWFSDLIEMNRELRAKLGLSLNAELSGFKRHSGVDSVQDEWTSSLDQMGKDNSISYYYKLWIKQLVADVRLLRTMEKEATN